MVNYHTVKHLTSLLHTTLEDFELSSANSLNLGQSKIWRLVKRCDYINRCVNFRIYGTISLVCLVYYLFRYVGHKLVEDSAEYKGIIYVGFVLYGFMIVSSLVIIPGVQLDKRYLLLPWIYIIILMVLYDTGSVALLTTVHMEREKTLHVWEIIWVFFYLLRLAANCYCFTCVVSQYQELSDGRGTYDYLYKPRRRRRFRNGSQFDLDTFDLPFGVHLPPYIEEDRTENNPPAYETIYPQQEISTQPNNTENEYAEIEINQQNTTFTNDHYTQIDNNSYPLPVDENCYHSNPENVEQDISENRLPCTSVQSNLNHSQSLTFGRYIDVHGRPLSCCYGDEVYHFPHCPHHIHQRHLHGIYHNQHPHHHHHLHHHRDSSSQLAGPYQFEQGEGLSLGQDLRCVHDSSLSPSSRSQQESRSGLQLDNPGFKRDSQCYEVTVNIE